MPNTQIKLTDLPEEFRKFTVVVSIDSPEVGIYPFILSVPFDFIIEGMSYALSNGSVAGGSEVDVTFQVEINDGSAVDVTWTGPVTSVTASSATAVNIVSTSTNTGEAGDLIQLNVTAIDNTGGDPEKLLVQFTIERTSL